MNGIVMDRVDNVSEVSGTMEHAGVRGAANYLIYLAEAPPRGIMPCSMWRCALASLVLTKDYFFTGTIYGQWPPLITLITL